jgi:L-aspartate oxidase
MIAEVDFLVIGSGIAGLTYAMGVEPHGSTLILTKKSRAESNSNYAQGGIAGVMSREDDVKLHAQDTYTAGAGLCHEDAVEILVSEGPERIRELISLGASFNMEQAPDGSERLSLGREGGHSRNRIVHAVDRTGWEMERTLLSAVKDRPTLRILEHFFVLDLALSTDGSCAGAYALDSRSGEVGVVKAGATLLATGGCGQVYRHTTNPAIATGDGVAMAWRAGAAVANMEFIQFHPTSLYHPEGHSFLISEAVRGEGGLLRLRNGERFMDAYHPLAELAPRDVVARAIHAERLRRGEPCVYLDVTHLEAGFLKERFPTIYERCLSLGLDIARNWIPVVPAAHYACGGIQTDLNGHTGLPGLFAAGEVACTGVHGANRLASNSLLEAMVFGHRAAQASVMGAKSSRTADSAPAKRFDGNAVIEPEITVLRRNLQTVMNDRVGIVRNDRDLESALNEIDEIAQRSESLVTSCSPDPDLWEMRNLAAVAQIIVRSALTRKESRGLNYNTDHPETDDVNWKRDTVLRKAGSA